MRFQTIVAPTITELSERQIQGMILSGQVEPGEKLPTEAELAENMHISKSAVHAGIKNLERIGFLRVSPRHGVYIADWAECGNVDTLISILKYRDGKLDKATTASLLQTRNAIEGLAVRLFVPKRTDDDIAALRTIIRDFRQAAQQPDLPLRVLGPTPGNIEKINENYRYKLTIKCRADKRFRDLVRQTLGLYEQEKLPSKATVVVDMHSDGDI